MTDIPKIEGSMLRLLERAARSPTIHAFYEGSAVHARALIEYGLLEPVRAGEYRITRAGTAYLEFDALDRVAEIDSTPLVFDDFPEEKDLEPSPSHKPYARRKTAQTPAPPSGKGTVEPIVYGRLRTRQKEILRFIDRFTDQIGYPPTIREIGDAVKISSSSVVVYNIDSLIAAGWLDRTHGVSRSLRLIQPLPGQKPKLGHSTPGAMTITINLLAKPEDIIAAAMEGIERLQEMIAINRPDTEV